VVNAETKFVVERNMLMVKRLGLLILIHIIKIQGIAFWLHDFAVPSVCPSWEWFYDNHIYFSTA
jgi:hypothetical protein